MSADSTTAYEAHAHTFLVKRDQSTIGADVAEGWAASLTPSSDVLEIACGGGLPVTRSLVRADINLWAIDSSHTLTHTFSQRFPHIPIRCERAQDSTFFERSFDAVISVGLIFLLSTEDQLALIHRVADVLGPGGRWLFTAPMQTGSWTDINTGHTCQSLGDQQYLSALKTAGFGLMQRHEDEGNNHYYDVELTG
jgi:cyclopropane fatty-acyl-phospholipid synthase-like methyltransferase